MLSGRVEQELDLLLRHVIILDRVQKDGPIGILKLSEKTGIPEHRVRYSLRVLEQRGLIAPSARGAVCTDAAGEFFRHFEADINNMVAKIDKLKAWV